MFNRDRWKEILEVLTNNWFRTVLTAFGVFWGIFILIILLAAGKGLENGINQDFGDIATNTMFMWTRRTTKAYEGLPKDRNFEFKREDVQSIRDNIPNLRFISPRNQLGGFRGTNNVVRGLNTGAYNVYGDYPEIINQDPMTVTSGLNAMAHAAEALYARDRNPLSRALAVEGLSAFASALPRVTDTPDDLEARQATQEGAWACGTVLGQVGMALHHKLCHTLGGSLNLPHAETHAIILPHATAYNQTAAAAELAPIGKLLGGDAPGQALWDFAKSLNAPMALKDLGVAEKDLDRMADLATQNPYWNPREITKDGIRALLGRAWSGGAPQA